MSMKDSCVKAHLIHNTYEHCQRLPMPWMRLIALADAARVPARNTNSGSNYRG
jgi:hypothetical protein